MSLTEPELEISNDKEEDVKETKVRNKYTVYGKVNSKGTRYEVTKIIEADNEEIASSIYKERIKREFSGIRNITCVKVNEYKDEDTEYTKEIEVAKSTVESDKDKNEIELVINGETISKPNEVSSLEFNYIVCYLVSLKKHSLSLYTCYYTSKKKLNNSYKKNNLLCYIGFNEVDAYNEIKKEINSNGIIFKEKYIHEFTEVNVRIALSNPIIRSRMINNAIEKYGSLEEACKKLKEEITLC